MLQTKRFPTAFVNMQRNVSHSVYLLASIPLMSEKDALAAKNFPNHGSISCHFPIDFSSKIIICNSTR